jgi:alkylation response protein AidB-like acyl-CoA dehydrogenase
MDQFVFGAAITDEKFVYLWVPVEREAYGELFADASPPGGDWGEMSASPPMSLCAMTASATVEFGFRGWFVPQAHWLQDSDRETMRRNDRNNVLGATAMPLGCARAGVRVLAETAERRNIGAVRRAAGAFSRELEEVKGAVVSGLVQTAEPGFFEKALEIRAWCIDLAMRAAHAAVTASSGAANTRTHPAQRLLREAMFYTIQAQTHEVMDATLARLERNTP